LPATLHSACHTCAHRTAVYRVSRSRRGPGIFARGDSFRILSRTEEPCNDDLAHAAELILSSRNGRSIKNKRTLRYISMAKLSIIWIRHSGCFPARDLLILESARKRASVYLEHFQSTALNQHTNFCKRKVLLLCEHERRTR